MEGNEIIVSNTDEHGGGWNERVVQKKLKLKYKCYTNKQTNNKQTNKSRAIKQMSTYYYRSSDICNYDGKDWNLKPEGRQNKTRT